MKIAFVLAAALAAAPLFAADAPPLKPYPDDFTPAACASPITCRSFPQSEMPSAAFTFLGLNMDVKWLAANWDKLHAAIEPLCRKQSTCIATPGNSRMFCNDLIAPMLRGTCDSLYPAKSDDYNRCREFMETYALGMDQMSVRSAAEAQKCAGPPQQHEKPPIVWMSPETLPRDYTGWVTFYAVDPDTHVPVPAKLTFEGQKHYAPSNPTGEAATYYPMKLPFKYVETPNAAGHRDLLAPLVTVTPANYPPVQFRLATVLPRAVVTMPKKTLKRGAKTTITAKDAETGKPVELRVYVGDAAIGNTNEPLTIDWPKNRKRPEIWARSLFNKYNDVVVLPAEK